MVEIWLDKARGSIAGWADKPVRCRRIFSPGNWIAIFVLAFFFGRIVWLRAGRPAHLKEITDAFGAINLLQNPAQFNQDFTKFTGVTILNTRGVGLYLYDTTTGNRRLLDTQKVGPGPWRDDYDLKPWAWSSDSSSLVYSMSGTMVVYPLDTNLPPTRYSLGTNGVLDVVWLNPAEFVWKESGALGHGRKSADRPWEFQKFPLPGRIAGLKATDSHTIAWAQDGYICRYDFSQDPAGSNFVAAVRSSRMDAPPTNNIILWLDASILKLSNNAPVSLLTDLSPAGNAAVDNQKPPTFNAPGSASSLNGRGTIHFSSSNTHTIATGLVTTKSVGISGNQPRTIYAVMRRDVGRLMISGFGNAGVSGAYFGVADQYDGFYLPATMAADNKGPVAPRNWNVLSVVWDGHTESGYVNGELKCTAQIPLKTEDGSVELGIRTVKAGAQSRAAASDGDFAELLVYNRVLTRSERRQVERYLSAKWFGINHISSKNPLAWCDTGLDGVTEFLYAPDSGKFFINTTKPGRSSLYIFNPASDSETNTIPLLRDRALNGVQWSGDGQYIYAESDHGRQVLFAGDASGKEPQMLAEFESIGWFRAAPNGLSVMIWGVLTNEPAESLWEYDTVAKNVRSVAAYSLAPSSFARNMKSSSAVVRLPTGGSITLTVFTPPKFDRQKKYPLVLGDTYVPDPIHGQWLQSGMAAGGAFVVFVNRPYWTGGIDKWEENVRAAYDVLRRDPCIDTERVYLIGASAETQYLSGVLEKTPGLWKGAILLNPGRLPDFSKSPRFQNRPKIFISAGAEEHEDDRWKRFQQDALQKGALVEYAIEPTETHRFVGSAAKLARLQAINHFIFEE